MAVKSILTSVAVLTSLAQSPAWALRCGTELIEPGDKTFEVRRACGEPISDELVGYTLSPNGERELVIKEWIYGPRSGVYDYLIFHGTTLVEIETRRKQ